MTQHLPMFVRQLLLPLSAVWCVTGCDSRPPALLPAITDMPEVGRAAGNALCASQQDFEQSAALAIRGTETLVVATGLLSAQEMAAGERQMLQLGEQGLSAAQSIAGDDIPKIDCSSLGRDLVGLAAETTRSIR